MTDVQYLGDAVQASTPAESTRRPWWMNMFRLSDVYILIGVALAFLALPSLETRRLVVTLIVSYAIVGVGLVLLFGAGGQLSLGHAIFFAAGAFTAANISGKSAYGFELEVLAALGIGFVVGVAVGLPALRVSGLYLAIATFALSFAGQQILFEWKAVSGGGAGMPVGPLRLFGNVIDGKLSLLKMSIVLLAILIWIASNLLRGRTGRALHAVRTSESASSSVAAINVGWLKLFAFGLSAAFAAAGGVVYMHAISYANPENFDVDLSILFMLTIIIGGVHSLAGSILGAAFVLGMPEVFRSVQQYEGMLYGGILLVLIIFSPKGLVGLFTATVRAARRLVSKPQDTEPVADLSPLQPRVDRERSGGARLELDKIVVQFGGLVAVNRVSFVIEPGQVVGLLGPNGAGKTTLFNGACGLVPASGTVRINGNDISRQSIRQRSLAGIGRTFQNLNLHDDRTALDHVLIGMDRRLRYHRLAEALRAPWVVKAEHELHERAHMLLRDLGLGHLADALVQDLPYGIQKRVDVARALATQPQLLLLDEPAAGLPSAEANEIIGRVLEIARAEGTTVVIIEHNVELVASVADRVIVLDAGQVIADGTAQEALTNPAVIVAYLGA